MNRIAPQFTPLLLLLLLLALSRAPLSVLAEGSEATTTATTAATTSTTTSTATTGTSAGVQTNFGDVSFAGGMTYDPDHQIVYVTGQVGSHSCFVGVLKRVEADAPSSPTKLEFLSRQVFDQRAICQTVAFRRDVSRPGNALLLSLAEEGGLLTDLREEGSRKAKQYGGMVALKYSPDGSTSEYLTDQSVLMYQTAAVTIPRSIATDPKRTNRVFVATMTSDATDIQYRDAFGSPHKHGDGGGITTKPNLTPAGGMLKYGNNYAMTVEAIRLATEFSAAKPQWRKPFGVKRNSDTATRSGVTVNQVYCGKSREGATGESTERGGSKGENDRSSCDLYVVGSTLGSGPAFGKPEFDNDKGYGLVAGFVTKLDSDTGSLESSRRFVFDLNVETQNSERNIGSNPLRDTYIEALCESPGENDDEDAIYVVGSYDRFVKVDRSRFLDRSRSLQARDGGTGGNGGIDGEDDDAALDDDAEFDDDASGDDVDDDDVDDDDVDDDDVDDDDVDDDGSLGEDGEEEDDDMIDDDNYFEDEDEDEAGGADNGQNTSDRTPDRDEPSSEPETIATPFVAKLKASTLETIWQKDFESTADARALGCGIDPKSKAMYVAGIVEDDGELVGMTRTLRGDDVFVMRLDSSNGAVSWSKQLGTSKDDRLAYGGSGLVVLDGEQGVLLMGDTTDNLYSVSDKDSEVFVVEIDADGNLPGTTEGTGIDSSTDVSLVKLSYPVQVGEGESGSDEASDKGKTSKDVADGSGGGIRPGRGGRSPRAVSHFFSLVITICIVTLIICKGFSFMMAQKKKREASERALVFSYLQHFDLEDIDVKQAATGGWHGTYVNSLAQGVNSLEDANGNHRVAQEGFSDEIVEQKLSNVTHSSVVRDILFMDDYDDSVFSSVKANKSTDSDDLQQQPRPARGKDGIVRDPIEYGDSESGEDPQKVDPWGTEII